MRGLNGFAAVLLLAAAAANTARPRAAGPQPGVAYLTIDLTSGAALASENPGRLDTPIAPGSVIKIATLAAALESGVIDGRTGIVCSREVVVAGHHLTCTHPDLHRPLRPAEALAQSCNVYFATIASRLPRAAFDRALRELGLPPSDPGQPVAAAALGVEGLRASPRRLLDMLVRVTKEPTSLGWRPTTLGVIREGLRGAAEFGTASALRDRGVPAMAKTGTTIANGVSQGIVVGVTPAAQPTRGFVLLASGAAGLDAAALAAERLRPGVPPAVNRAARVEPSSLVRVGIAREGGGYTVRTMPLEDYVAGVVAGEAAGGSTPAALEALAITVRTFTLANRGRHSDEGFDLCDLTHCQALRPSTAATSHAALVTSGRVLLDRGAPAKVFYTASCGGHSERPSNVWPGATDPAFLPSRPDDACGGVPAWASDLPVGDLMRALRAGGFKGDSLRDMRVTDRTTSGRVAWLRLDGLTPHEISGEDLRTLVGRTLGWQHIRSTAFDLRRTGTGYHIAGRGAGHGVGLCVIGSAQLAARGESPEAILARYFPGLHISPPASVLAAPLPEVHVSLPATEREQQEGIHRIAVRTIETLAGALQTAAPPGVTLRFHPTIESYQRETHQPWFTAGATHGADIQLLPLPVLRARGLLDRTIAHELVHVLTGEALAGRPLWVSEGIASYFAASAVGVEREVDPGQKSLSCPEDHEFRSPASQETLRSAYARATACVGRQVDAGKSWRDVK